MYSVDRITHDRNIGHKSLNGPEGSVSAATVDLLHLHFGLTQLENNTEKLSYRNINMLSCMVLYLENLDSTVNKKYGTQTVLTYAQSFASSSKESIKESAKYLISREVWYPLPENRIKLEELKFPKRKKNSSMLSPDKTRKRRPWASSKDTVVQQRSGMQETTMARSGTLSKNAYYEELKPISDVEKKYIDEHESDSEILQYGSDETSVENEESDNEESLNLGRAFEISNTNSFLIGHSSRFGRSVKFNRRCLY